MKHDEINSGKLYYTMGEVADSIGESLSLVRFWSDRFPELFNPKRNKKGNRLFSPQEYNIFMRMHNLVKVRGMKLDSAAMSIKRSGDVKDRRAEALRRLVAIRQMLKNIEDSLT